MKLEPECIGCLFDQVLRAFKLLKPDISRETIINAQKRLMQYLIKVEANERASPINGKVAYHIVADVLGVKDPYRQLKEKYNRLALSYYDEVKRIVISSKDPLFKAIIAAALGNTIDFATQHQIDVVNDLKHFSTRDLGINDYSEFKNSLENADELLILLDNAGEIVFDKLLVEIIQKLYPHISVICAVRSAPIINDATMDDANFVGLTEIAQVIEAQEVPGIDLSEASDEFKEYFYNKSGVILSKGQGNFESLYTMEVPNKDTYYLFKVKCNLMERIFNVKIGTLIFKRKTPGI